MKAFERGGVYMFFHIVKSKLYFQVSGNRQTIPFPTGNRSCDGGGSKDFPEGGLPTLKVGLLTGFCRKLHENERIWTPASLALP